MNQLWNINLTVMPTVALVLWTFLKEVEKRQWELKLTEESWPSRLQKSENQQEYLERRGDPRVSL